jgi:hypothetical protein
MIPAVIGDVRIMIVFLCIYGWIDRRMDDGKKFMYINGP